MSQTAGQSPEDQLQALNQEWGKALTKAHRLFGESTLLINVKEEIDRHYGRETNRIIQTAIAAD